MIFAAVLAKLSEQFYINIYHQFIINLIVCAIILSIIISCNRFLVTMMWISNKYCLAYLPFWKTISKLSQYLFTPFPGFQCFRHQNSPIPFCFLQTNVSFLRHKYNDLNCLSQCALYMHKVHRDNLFRFR